MVDRKGKRKKLRIFQKFFIVLNEGWAGTGAGAGAARGSCVVSTHEKRYGIEEGQSTSCQEWKRKKKK